MLLRTWLHLAQQGVVWRASISFLFSVSSDLWRFLFSFKDASQTVVRRSQRDQTKMQGWSVVRGSRISNDWQQSFQEACASWRTVIWMASSASKFMSRSEPSALVTKPFIQCFDVYIKRGLFVMSSRLWYSKLNYIGRKCAIFCEVTYILLLASQKLKNFTHFPFSCVYGYM